MAWRTRISYEKQMRDKAKADGCGLATIDVIFPGKTKVRLGRRLTVQAYVNESECEDLEKLVWEIVGRYGLSRYSDMR